MKGYDIQSVKTILNNVKTSLMQGGILRLDCNIEYGGSAISIQNNDELYVWLRIYNSRVNNGMYMVEISNITLPENKRHKGIFTRLMKRLAKCKYVDEITITSVCTPEMFRWCHKNNMKVIRDNNSLMSDNNFTTLNLVKL